MLRQTIRQRVAENRDFGLKIAKRNAIFVIRTWKNAGLSSEDYGKTQFSSDDHEKKKHKIRGDLDVEN